MAPRLLNPRSMPSSASREEAPAGGGRCGEGPGPWGHPEPGRGWGVVWGACLAEDMGTCPLSICHRKWRPQMPESPRHVATPVCSH